MTNTSRTKDEQESLYLPTDSKNKIFKAVKAICKLVYCGIYTYSLYS